MKALPAVALLFAVSLVLSAQERPVPKDSLRVSLPGCAHGRSFVVARRETPEPVNSDVEPGRRFRLNGEKKLLKEIAARPETMVQITGLIRKSDVKEPGIPIAGGRIRIGGGQPQAPMGSGTVGRDPMYNVGQLDVESWMPLPDSCPAR